LRWLQKREAGEQRNKNQKEGIRFHIREVCLFCSPHSNDEMIREAFGNDVPMLRRFM
jgi:hypothetical protein